MVDSVAVFPPGYRLTDNDTGEPLAGATLSFFDAGTTNPKTVYATADLDQGEPSVPLGTSVVTDALGCPTSNGTAKTDVYVGIESYKIIITDANGVTIETKDNRPGAPQTISDFDPEVTATFPVVTKSLDYSIVAADQNTTFKGNSTSGDVTFTLPSAVDVGTGWRCKIQHAGTANRVLIVVASGSGQTINEGSKSFGGGYALALNGEDIEIASDGGNWAISGHTPPFVKLAQGIIPITDILSTPPGSPVAGAFYLLTGNSGDWSAFAAKDLAQYTGAGWVNFTPYTDCGWILYVADENRNYQFVDSTWVAQPLSTPATQTTMEAQTAGTPVTADMQKYHPGHAKAWVSCSGNGSVIASFGVSGVTRLATGSYRVTFSVPFSSANYASVASIGNVSGGPSGGSFISCSGQSASLASFATVDGGSAVDTATWCVAFFGDQ